MHCVHRSLLARYLAAFLVCLAASPVTAPFTTCALSEFASHERSTTPTPGQVPHPGHQVSELGVKASPHVNNVTFQPVEDAGPDRVDVDRHSVPVSLGPQRRVPLQAVLRI